MMDISWWEDVNKSSLWQDRTFHLLSALYGILSTVALVQLVRIQTRVPEYGVTTQKVFHFLNFLVHGFRGLVFLYMRDVQGLNPGMLQHILLDMPGLVFFTTYAFIVLFWAEIYYYANNGLTDGLRPIFFKINGAVYTVQLLLWWWNLVIPSKLFFAGVSLLTVIGFYSYGGMLYMMLKNFLIAPQGRANKMDQVGYVLIICITCFLIRCIMMCFNAFDGAAELDALDHPILTFIYYVLVEILPSSLVMFILRKSPPKRGIE